jgi:hypothetical protein
VLLDVMMPGKTGFEVCQEVRADDALKGVRILMLTAKGRDTDVAKGLALGADAYMTKPFSTKELAAKVRDMLGARHEDRPRARPGRRVAAGAVLARVCLARGRWPLLVWSTLEPPNERAALAAMLEPARLVCMAAAVGALGAAARALYRRWAAAPRAWTSRRVVLATDVRARAHRPRGSAGARAGRGDQPAGAPARRQLRADIAQQVREASRGSSRSATAWPR